MATSSSRVGSRCSHPYAVFDAGDADVSAVVQRREGGLHEMANTDVVDPQHLGARSHGRYTRAHEEMVDRADLPECPARGRGRVEIAEVGRMERLVWQLRFVTTDRVNPRAEFPEDPQGLHPDAGRAPDDHRGRVPVPKTIQLCRHDHVGSPRRSFRCRCVRSDPSVLPSLATADRRGCRWTVTCASL